MSEAQQQECPRPEKNKLRWEGIDIWATRARICDESLFEGQHSLWLNWSKSEFEYPLECRSNGLWVYGPIKERPTQPPFTLKLTRMGDSVDIDIFVHWSLWYDINSPGYIALKQAICRIIDQGWELSEHTPLTEPKIL
ncbi:hypothetical protein A6770_38835 [Nostoc minutum NIES-26]|uniref:Uncharacterized protein n=1 Tax=Nostoc minutum NIES-26 TaxID=1844469 RepID=A0A367RSK2_9NOSO|nr:hypothetical protein A6770_38835 [Nostoc minutum NIES-26]